MSHTYEQLLVPGRDGDRPVYVKLTARQVAIQQLIIDTALNYGIGNLVIEAVGDALGDPTESERARLAFDISQKRIGIAMCRVLGDTDRAAQLSAELALLDGEVTGL
jgi:hypothetical protein